MEDFECIILAAGEGTRMKSSLPKVLHRVSGIPMIFYVIDSLKSLGDIPAIIVTGYGSELVQSAIKEHYQSMKIRFAYQEKRLGTADAVKTALALGTQSKNIIILMGDMPLVSSKSISHLIREHLSKKNSITIALSHLDDPSGYGRIIRSSDEKILMIKEERDCNPTEKKIKEVNTGIYCFNSDFLKTFIIKIKNNNSAGEFYLTDIVELGSREPDIKIGATMIPQEEAIGINEKAQIEKVEKILLERTKKENHC